jgi:hypothetical protein
MPSRNDAYKTTRAMLLAAGCASVQQAYHFPEDAGLPANNYPLAAYVEDTASQIEPQGNYAYLLTGNAKVQLWIYTGLSDSPGLGASGWDQMDALHDSILRQVAKQFAPDLGPVSNTMQILPVTFSPWYWYSMKASIIGAELGIKWKMAFA